MRSTLFLAAAVAAGASLTLNAQNAVTAEDFSSQLSVGYESLHIYRGVDSAADGSIVWMNAGTTFRNQLDAAVWYGTGAATDYEEIDLMGGYTMPVGPVNVRVGVLWYHFPGDFAGDSTDYNLTVSRTMEFSDQLTMTPSLLAVYNDGAEAMYYEGGVAIGYVIDEQVAINTYIGLGYAGDEFRGQNVNSGLDNLTVVVRVPVRVMENVFIEPYIGHSEDLDAIDEFSEPETWLGGSLRVTF